MTIQEQIDALRARVEQLERERWSGPPRLGPQPPKQAEVEEKLVEAVTAGIKSMEEKKAPPARDAKGQVMCTTNGKPVEEVRAAQTNETGQHDGYIVLCPEERAKGFVRPYRDRYKHVGKAWGPNPKKGCGAVTTMSRELSETYARDPKFYGATFCCNCNQHLPVNEFVWTADGQEVGS